MKRTILGACALAIFAASAVADASPPRACWRVDAGATGPGALPSIDAAIARAAPGDTIVVAPGLHAMPGLVERGVTIVGEPGAVLDPRYTTLRVVGLPAGEHFVLAGFALRESDPPRIQLERNVGSLHFAAIHGSTDRPDPCRSPGVWIVDCTEVTFDDCSWHGAPALHVTRSSIRISGGVFVGASSPRAHRPGRAILAEGAELSIHDAVLRGADSFFGVAPQPAVEMLGGQVELLGADLLARGGAWPDGRTAPAVMTDASATVVVAENAYLDPGPHAVQPVVGTTPRIVRARPTARWSETEGGLELHFTGGPSLALPVFAGAAAPPRATPIGTVWLDPGSLWTVGALALDATGHGRLRLPLPPGPRPVGATVVVQAATVEAPGLVLSSPTLVVVTG